MNKHCAKLVKLYSFFEYIDGYLVYSKDIKDVLNGYIFIFKIDDKPEIVLSDVANKCNYYLSLISRGGEFKTGNKDFSDEFYFNLLDNNITIIHEDTKKMIDLNRRWTIKQIVNND